MSETDTFCRPLLGIGLIGKKPLSGPIPGRGFLFVDVRMKMEVVKMVFQRQLDLLERKRGLGWTNREVGNVLGVAPGVASSKLNGFIVLTSEERRQLEKAMDLAEARQTGTAAAISRVSAIS